MKILIVSQYFWPEDFRINDIALGFKEAGHEVEIFTGIPNYPEGKVFEDFKFSDRKYYEYNGMKIYRVPIISRGKGFFRLALNYLSFMIFGLFRSIPLLFKRYDRIFIFQLSPITLAIPGIFISKVKKIKSIMYVQDLWPESLFSMKSINSNVISNILEKICCAIYKSQDILLITSRGFKDRLIKKGINSKKIIYFPQWAEDFYSSSFENNFRKEHFKITFAGNIGKAQNVDVIIKAAKYIRDKYNYTNIEWQILGDGSEYGRISDLIKENCLEKEVKLLGRKPSNEMPKYFSEFDVLLVTLGNYELLNITLPAKVQSYMASGKPILGAISGEGQRIIKESNCGLASDAGDYKALAENAVVLYNMSESDRKSMGDNGRRFFEENFTRKDLLSKLEMIMS